MPIVGQVVGAHLPRRSMLVAINRLYDQLENHSERYRRHRDPDRPDDYFEFVLQLADENGNWHTLSFSVDDKQAEGYLFVDAVTHRKGKSR